LKVQADVRTGGLNVSFTVTNTGVVPGCEVAQIYVKFPPSAGEPPMQLKGFRKTRILKPADAQTIVVHLRPREFSVWDTRVHAWKIVEGSFELNVGASSRDIRLVHHLSYKERVIHI